MRIAISLVYTYSSVSVKNYDQIPPWERKTLKNVPQSQRVASQLSWLKRPASARVGNPSGPELFQVSFLQLLKLQLRVSLFDLIIMFFFCSKAAEYQEMVSQLCKKCSKKDPGQRWPFTCWLVLEYCSVCFVYYLTSFIESIGTNGNTVFFVIIFCLLW